MNCLTRISQYYNSFTKAERRIADYITQNSEQTVKLSIYGLASAAGVAPSTVTRFVHNLEYKSFNEMRIELVRNVDVKTVNDFNEILQWGNNKDDLNQHFLHNITSVCQEALNINRLEKFREAVSIIHRAKLVYFFGIGASSLIVQDLQQKLMKMHKCCIYNIDGNFGTQNAIMAGPDDVVVAVSYSGITREVNLAVQRAKENGCKVIAITRYGHTTLSELADICLSVPNVEQVTKVAAIFSRYAQLFIVDILFLNFVNESGEDPAKMLTDYRSLLLRLKE
ncbi:MurR/RpiR family transcriptional regulator [Caproiciproducens sp. R2]|uniref:MurR/RpiR family transcriptional regulator n=1 Tax=Caproiciproducens sp. R2 TaxID=3435187 RepID=UPI0040332AD8